MCVGILHSHCSGKRNFELLNILISAFVSADFKFSVFNYLKVLCWSKINCSINCLEFQSR